MRKGSAWNVPPRNVATPVIVPRWNALPRPVSSPSSDNASLMPIEIAAPRAAARPTSRAAREPLTYAAAKIGASVEIVPSIRPMRPGWTTCSSRSRSEAPRHWSSAERTSESIRQ